MGPGQGGCRGLLESLAEGREWLRRLLAVTAAMYPPDDVHGLGHVLRVTCLALKLVEGLEADVDVVVAAGLLHDIGRVSEDWSGIHHAVLSAIIAPWLLRSVGFPEEKISRVVEAILSHSFSLGFKPGSVEAAAISDADKLDAIGAVGIYRAAAEGFRRRRGIKGTIRHYYEKLARLRDMLILPAARRIAEERTRLLDEFFKELELEAGDEDVVVDWVLGMVRSAGAHIIAGAQRRSTSSTHGGC